MWAKLMLGAAAVLAAALFAFLGDRLIAAYGNGRYPAGLADGQVRQLPAILAANAQAARAGLDARDRIIAAEQVHADETARLAAMVERSDEEVKAYEAGAAGRAGCLDAERVRAIEAGRAALFSAAGPEAAAGDDPGPVPADAAAPASRRQPG